MLTAPVTWKDISAATFSIAACTVYAHSRIIIGVFNRQSHEKDPTSFSKMRDILKIFYVTDRANQFAAKEKS